ncbi:MAG: hypothetical protein K2W78_02365 [Xanthobacteraceae bacterium]|nr:hypothetical protein [Xanthobacteraceae bacterium]
MDWFIHSQNLQRYRKLLEETKDGEKRRMILALLAEEQAKEEKSSQLAGGDVAAPIESDKSGLA